MFKRITISLSCLLIFLFNNQIIAQNSKPKKTTTSLIVLGTVQDGGSPPYRLPEKVLQRSF